jgi:3-(3-hydroxy-phenyl)propionate hydroxylase
MSVVDYQTVTFPYTRAADHDAATPIRHPVIVVGAGPVGLATAIDLAQRGTPVVLLDDDDRPSSGSRAICFAKRTLEIADRLGVGDRMVDKGVTWNVGRVFLKDAPLYTFDLLPEGGHQRPAFINLQQYYVEGFFLDRARALPNLDLRWNSKVSALTHGPDGVMLTVDTPDGVYEIHSAYVVAADGGRSAIRRLMGLESRGQTFQDRFLIADVKMEAAFPAERWFWFNPPFHPNQSVLLHQQPDHVWRIDFQLGWDADPVAERDPDRVIQRVQALLGPDAKFELEWVSIYTFSCLRMDRFRHGRVLFAGDSAHGVSPFGARGANSGIQDADNLGWKLNLVLGDIAPDQLLDTYDVERGDAADENILNSTRSTDFITPKNAASRAFRDASLELARDCPFARSFVNSGRLSTPTSYRVSPLNTLDEDTFGGAMAPGAPATDAPVTVDGRPDWFLRQLPSGFSVVYFHSGNVALPDFGDRTWKTDIIVVVPQGTPRPSVWSGRLVEDAQALLADRYDARPGTVYLLRPDRHVAARFRTFDDAALIRALNRAQGKEIGMPC